MSVSASTLVETINIDADDFTDNFLTCPTCMGAYDDSEHTPKLLPCSHTLCRQCLERIASSTAVQIQTTETAVSATPAGLLTINNSLSRSIAAADAAMASINANNDFLNASPLLNINSSRLSNSSIISNSSRPSSSQNGPSVVTDLCIRCPICRETIILPRNGGIFNLPPSFIINQLIDLVKSRRSRDIIPRCVNHTNEELLYCETCDKAFCSICESHFTVATNADHIIIPFSIALKRITEIYLFKSSQCLNSFSLALANVQREIGNLNQTVESVAEQVESSFEKLKQLVDKRKEQVLAELHKIKEAKTQVLSDQVKLIVNEKQKLEAELKQYEQLSSGSGGGNHRESKSLGAKIHNINEKLDCLRTLCEPRENSFINFEFAAQQQRIQSTPNDLFENALRAYGRFKTSNTYPPLCSARVIDEFQTMSTNGITNGNSEYQNGCSDLSSKNNNNIKRNSIMDTLSKTISTNGHGLNGHANSSSNGGSGLSGNTYPANLRIRIQIDTVDYYGNKRNEGGDPVSVLLTDPAARQQLFKSPADGIFDLGNGSYQFKIVPNQSGKYRVDVNIFSRPINDMPIWLNIVENIESIWTFGGSGGSSLSSLAGSANSGGQSSPQTGGGGGTGTLTNSTHSSLIRSFSLHNKGGGDRDFNMPISVRCLSKYIFILDSGNNRIKVLSKSGQFVTHLKHEGLADSSATALTLRYNKIEGTFSLLSLNWRLKCMTNMTLASIDEITTAAKESSRTINSFELELEEPISLMETCHPDVYIIQDNRKRIYLTTGTGIVLYDNLDQKIRVECGIKNITTFCGNLIYLRMFVAESSSGGSYMATIYELDLDWLCDYKLTSLIQANKLAQVDSIKPRTAKNEDNVFTFKKYSYPSQRLMSSSLTSLISTSSITSTSTTTTTQSGQSTTNGKSSASGCSYTALWHDVHTNKLLAARTDKHKTVIEIFDSTTCLYEYAIESSSHNSNGERQLKKVTSLCATCDGRLVCVDLVQNCAKMFRFI